MGRGELIWLVLFRPFKLYQAVKAGRVSWGRVLVVSLASAVVAVVVAVLAAIALRITVLEAFKVPAGSMFPGLEIGDHLFVTKSTYGTFTKSSPTRGDVVVFQYPDPNPDAERPDYVKRVMAVAGDELSFENGAPIINGWRVPSCKLGRASATLGDDSARDYVVVVEFLEGRAYLVALEEGRGDGRQGPYHVKPGEFWVAGDNRNNSFDSRAWFGGRGGGVPIGNLKGRARWLWFPQDRQGIDLAGKLVLPKVLEQLQPELERCLEAVPDLAHTSPPPPK